MGKTGSRLLSIFFILVIFAFGGTTLLKARGDISDAVKTKEITEVPTAIENSLTENFKSRNNWININGLFQRMIGVTVIRDAGDIDVFKMSNGKLTYEYPDCKMKKKAKAVKGLKEFTEDLGIDFMYVQLPCKAYSDDLMPVGTHTYGYADSDEMIKLLNKYDVPVLDIREEIDKEGFDIDSLFFNTDHHWKPSTALWAAGVISNRLAEDVTGYTYDPAIYDKENYKQKIYKDWFLGSLGRRTGRFFGGVDDFEVLIPEFDTDFDVYNEAQVGKDTFELEGPFKDTLLRLSILDKKDYFSGETYFTYMGTEYRLSRVTNNMPSNGKKILLLRDSFSCTLLPYLSLSAGEVTAIDLRYHKKLKIKEYIQNNDFDAVIVAYNPSMFREKRAFQFDR